LRVAILGSEGFVGKNLVEGLQSEFDLILSDRYDISKDNYVQADILNLEQITKAVNGVDSIIHLAAHTLVSSFEDTIKNAQVNIIGLLTILEAARKCNVKKIIFTSASSMLGATTEKLVSEKHPALPKTAYGVTKLASEHYLRIYKELYDLDYVIFRFFNIYGPHQLNGLIPTIVSKLHKKESVTVFGKGNQIRDYVYIKDTPKFFAKALTSNIADHQIVNLGTGRGATVMDVIQEISKCLDINPSIKYEPERPGEISNFVADTTLLKSLFGSVPNTPLNEGLSNTIEWMSKNEKTIK